MNDGILGRLLTTLAVRVHAFALCEIQAGWQLAIGAKDAVTIHYVLAGSGTIAVGEHPSLGFGPNCMVIVPADLPQVLGFPGAARVSPGDSFGVLDDGIVAFTAGDGTRDILVACGTITATYAGALGLFDRLQDAIVTDLSDSARLRHAFAYMLEELVSPGLGTQAVTEALMKQCLIVLLREHLRNLGPRSPMFAALKDPALIPAVAAVVEAPAAPHSVESLAALCGMSRSAFAERFAATFGQGPNAFVQQVRLRLAAQMLAATSLPVKVVAASVGYASRSYFTRAFRAAYGDDPSGYRTRRASDAAAAEPSADAVFGLERQPDE